jgi:outer membrane protein assembly factor BamB
MLPRAFLPRFLALLLSTAGFSADQPQMGHAWTRNPVSPETGLPSGFNLGTGHNVRWSVELGTESHSTPVIARGRVLIGSNNGNPRDPRHQGDRGVLMCFDEVTGRFLWQLVCPKRSEDPYHDWPKSGLSSPATVEGDRVYVVSNRGEVLCLDLHGLANGNDGPFTDEARLQTPEGETLIPTGPLDADVLWHTDLTREAGIWSHDAAHTSILVHGNHLYLNSGTGVDNTHKKIRTPDAPSLLVLDKHTGRIIARDDENIAPRIFHCTWSSPSLAVINGKPRLFFAGGDGVLYGFDPLPQDFPTDGPVKRIKASWRFDFDPEAPKDDVHRYNSNKAESPSNIYGMPVIADGRLYVAGGGDWFWGKNAAWLKCIQPDGSGDVTASHLLWSAPLGRHTMSTPAVQDGLVYAADSMRTFHCLDAKTGQSLWTHELKGEVWASALIADGRVHIGTRRGDFWIFRHSREKQLLHQSDLGAPISATAVAANGTLYLASMKALHALALPTLVPPPEPRFDHVTIDPNISIGYGLAIADINGDRRPDIVLCDKSEIAWYRNPTWEKFVIARNLTPLDHVCVAAADIDGDGLAEIAVGAGWNPGDTRNSGALFFLQPPADRTQPWTPVPLPHDPTIHRIRWTRDARGRIGLLSAPLHGPGNHPGTGEGEGVRIQHYFPPATPDAAWTTRVLNQSWHKTHNIDPVQWDSDDADEILVAAKEGIFLVDPDRSTGLVEGRQLGSDENGGFGEVRAGRLADGKRFIAGISPMHGNQLVLLTSPGNDTDPWIRRVLDDSLIDGHALGCADFLGIGRDQIVAGWRAMNRPGVKVGLRLYTPMDATAREWRTTLIDDNEMACEDLQIADLDGDGRPDIIAAGRATRNLKIYWNRPGR